MIRWRKVAILTDSMLPRLTHIRKKKGLSQRALAQLADVGHVTIARIETGVFDPRLSTLKKLAEALKVRMNDLLDS